MSDPSWGPVGSLLQQKDPALYERVLAQHQAMVALERQRQGGAVVLDTRQCARCHTAFVPAQSNHRFCSIGCLRVAA